MKKFNERKVIGYSLFLLASFMGAQTLMYMYGDSGFVGMFLFFCIIGLFQGLGLLIASGK